MPSSVVVYSPCSSAGRMPFVGLLPTHGDGAKQGRRAQGLK